MARLASAPTGALLIASLLASALGPVPVAFATQVRAIALTGDTAPGVPTATFGAFPLASTIVCDDFGHATFRARTSTGIEGLWTDNHGALMPLATIGGTAPWNPGSGTFVTLAQPVMSDTGLVAFLGSAAVPGTLNGLWIQDGSGLVLQAGDGLLAPDEPAPSTFQIGGSTPSIALNRSGRLALGAYDGAGHQCIWSFDPPPSLARELCASTYNSGMGGFSYLASPGGISLNDQDLFAMNLGYNNGTTPNSWVSEGFCGLLYPELVNGQAAPAVGSIPPNSGIDITGIPVGPFPDVSDYGGLVCRSRLMGPGITANNQAVDWLFNPGGWHIVVRQGDSNPDLAPGETIDPYFAYNVSPELVSDAGDVALEAAVFAPGGTSFVYSLFVYEPDGTLHLLARDGQAAPGYPGSTLVVAGAVYAMNRYGQVVVNCGVRNSMNNVTSSLYVTDDSYDLVPMFRSGDTYTVRPGLTGAVAITSGMFMSGGSDGRPRNFSDQDEYFFTGTLTVPAPPGLAARPADVTLTSYNGVFAVKGPASALLSAGSPRSGRTGLESVAPNPVTGATAIAFTLAGDGPVRLEIFDLAGRRVRTLRDATLSAGRYSERWDGADDAGRALPRGLYVARLTAAGAERTRAKIALVR